MASLDEYTFRTFPAVVGPDGIAEPATAAWIEAERRGFHDPRLTPEALGRAASRLAADGRALTGAYRNAPGAASTVDTPAPETATAPVATFASFASTMNVGGGELLPTHLISNVTVRPTHRRRGLLRHLMTQNLAKAAADGFAVAALTVSEATIYRRFGFGVATWVDHITARTDERFRMLVTPTGRCELIEIAELRALAPAVFAAFHAAHPGSVDRHAAVWGRTSGAGDDSDSSTPSEDQSVYAAAHYSEGGEVDGYVSYRIPSQSSPLEVIDLVAADDNAYLALWNFLASIDLTDYVDWNVAPADDPLRWALTDWRVLNRRSVEDWVWLRILDVSRAFEARGYTAEAAGEVTLSITDALGYASGTYRLRVADARATVTRVDTAACDLELDAPELGSLYLGGVDPLTLLAAGRLTERTPGAARRLGALLAPTSPVYGMTHF